jgi:hypothetical protein
MLVLCPSGATEFLVDPRPAAGRERIRSSMKKTSKPTSKKPAAKKSFSKPKRKTEGESELTQVIERLDTIMEKLDDLLEGMAQLNARAGDAPVEAIHQSAEDTDDVEVASTITQADDSDPA